MERPNGADERTEGAPSLPRVHRSRVDLWLVAVVVYISFWLLQLAIDLFVDSRWPWLEIPAAVLLVALTASFFWAILGLRYEVGPDEVAVRCPPFEGRIPVEEIREVRRVYNVRPGPALSVNRLLVACRDPEDDTLLSPRDIREFLEDLQAADPGLIETREGLERAGT